MHRDGEKRDVEVCVFGKDADVMGWKVGGVLYLGLGMLCFCFSDEYGGVWSSGWKPGRWEKFLHGA